MEDKPFEVNADYSKEEALAALQEFAKKYPSTRAAINEMTPQELGSFLFIGAGPDISIQGMHYPDSALNEDACPNIFPGLEPGQIVAAFPDSLVTKIMEKLDSDYEKEYRDYLWQKVLGAMLESVVEMLEGNPLPSMNWDAIL